VESGEYEKKKKRPGGVQVRQTRPPSKAGERTEPMLEKSGLCKDASDGARALMGVRLRGSRSREKGSYAVGNWALKGNVIEECSLA